ncbi:MAG: hypothetical protein K2Z80_05295 [Xanthobacteraceae bacterium]|nr:hypothetical protein [Xanthobacteraceae bacterium]
MESAEAPRRDPASLALRATPGWKSAVARKREGGRCASTRCYASQSRCCQIAEKLSCAVFEGQSLAAFESLAAACEAASKSAAVTRVIATTGQRPMSADDWQLFKNPSPETWPAVSRLLADGGMP